MDQAAPPATTLNELALTPHLFHITTRERAKQIMQTGLRPRALHDQRQWERSGVGICEQSVYLCGDPIGMRDGLDEGDVLLAIDTSCMDVMRCNMDPESIQSDLNQSDWYGFPPVRAIEKLVEADEALSDARSDEISWHEAMALCGLPVRAALLSHAIEYGREIIYRGQIPPQMISVAPDSDDACLRLMGFDPDQHAEDEHPGEDELW